MVSYISRLYFRPKMFPLPGNKSCCIFNKLNETKRWYLVGVYEKIDYVVRSVCDWLIRSAWNVLSLKLWFWDGKLCRFACANHVVQIQFHCIGYNSRIFPMSISQQWGFAAFHFFSNLEHVAFLILFLNFKFQPFSKFHFKVTCGMEVTWR